MRILFDMELLGHALPENDDALSKKIKNFIHQRLGVLKEEIEKEDGSIIIIFLTKPPGIRFDGFSSALMKKMSDSLTDDDFRYFISSLQ